MHHTPEGRRRAGHFRHVPSGFTALLAVAMQAFHVLHAISWEAPWADASPRRRTSE